jgi:hypothetical protein
VWAAEDGLKPAPTFPDEVTRVCRRRRGDSCGRSGRHRGRELERRVGVGFAMAVERLAGRCWVGRFVLDWDSLWAVGGKRRRLGVGSRRWLVGWDRGGVLRFAPFVPQGKQDDRLVVLARWVGTGVHWRGRGRWSGRC